jgi:glycine/D-amino acid oxidase-like deaminating enzyme
MPVYDVVVVGGGNLGLWTAHRLAWRGFGRIAVLERGWAGGGATSRSAGVVRQQGGSETAAKLGRLSRELYLQLGEELGLGEAWAITEPEAGSDIKTTARRDGDGWVLNGEKWFVTGGEVRLNGRG